MPLALWRMMPLGYLTIIVDLWHGRCMRDRSPANHTATPPDGQADTIGSAGQFLEAADGIDTVTEYGRSQIRALVRGHLDVFAARMLRVKIAVCPAWMRAWEAVVNEGPPPDPDRFSPPSS